MSIELNTVTSGYNLSTINSNFQKIEDYINDKLLARAETGVPGEAAMERDLDMNSKDLLNIRDLEVESLTINGQPVGVPDIQYRGYWNTSTSYVRNDVVIDSAGNMWLAVTSSVGQVPSEGDYWTLFIPNTNKLLDVIMFGAVDDGVFDNTAVINTAVAVALTTKSTLYFPSVTLGKYRVDGTLVLTGSVLKLDHGVQILNSAGNPYTGGFGDGSYLSTVDVPGLNVSGSRLENPGMDYHYATSISATEHDNTKLVWRQYEGKTGTLSPYVLAGANTYYFQGYGQSGTFASGSSQLVGGSMNIYAANNGAGINITGTLTNGSNIITAVDDTSAIGAGGYISSGVAGIPANTFVFSKTSDTITMTSAFTGVTTVGAVINIVTGRSEFNPISLATVHSKANPAPRTNTYFDLISTGPTSSSSEEREGFLAGPVTFVQKWSPGNTIDIGHDGSYGQTITTRPGNGGYAFEDRTADRSYPLLAGLAINGWSGVLNDAPGGQLPLATKGYEYGIKIGGDGGSCWMPYNARSKIGTGIKVEDYIDKAIHVTTPHADGVGIAIQVDAGAGNVLVGTDQGITGFPLNVGKGTNGNLWLEEPAVGPSSRVGLQLGSNWQLMQDTLQDGTKDLAIYGASVGGTGAFALGIDTSGAVSLRTPLSASSGGTGNTGGAFTAYTPTLASTAGTITTVGARTGKYNKIGRMVTVSFSGTITTNGTGATGITITLPVAAASTGYQYGSGWERGVSNKQLNVVIPPSATSVTIFNYDGTYPGANGAVIEGTVTYEAAS